jgi:hypothetical protein
VVVQGAAGMEQGDRMSAKRFRGDVAVEKQHASQNHSISGRPASVRALLYR